MKIIYFVDDITSTNNEIIIHQWPYHLKFNIGAEVWDIRFIIGKMFNEKELLRVACNKIKLKTFFKESDFLIELVKEPHSSVFFTNQGITKNNLFIYKALKKNNMSYVIKKNKTHFLSRKISEIRYKKSKPIIYVINRLYGVLNRLYFRSHPGINEPIITLLGTEFDYNSHNYPIRNTKILFAHNYEYEKIHYRSESKASEDIILFLDQYLPFHPEIVNEAIDPIAYYKTVSEFLIKFKNASGLPVVMSLHPRGNALKIRPFINPLIEIEQNNTSDLIKKAKIVIGHISTSLLQVLILEKEYLLVTNNALNHTSVGRGIVELSKMLNLKIIHMDYCVNVNELRGLAVVNIRKNSIFEKYIKKADSPNQSEWDLLFSELIKLKW